MKVNKNNDISIYMATVVSGLENIAINEMSSKFAAIKIIDKFKGKILFTYLYSFKDLFTLKCIDNIYLFIDSFNIGSHKADLDKIPEIIKDINIKNSLLQANVNIKNKKIIVSASRSGKHTYSRFDVANIVSDALLQYYSFSKGTIEQHDIAFRIDIDDDRAYLYCKLTPASFRFRYRNKEFLAGALKASVAHAMVLISEPDFSDVFLDPFCGSGTIPYERAFYDAYAIMASDLSPERLQVAKKNLPDYIGINCWDACHTELSNCSVTKIVSNLPWGKQIEVDDINSLYTDFLREAKRILTYNGKIVLLTDEENALNTGAQINNLQVKKICNISLHGLHPSIFLLTKID
ncbi:MAG TPA: hypothetical protein GX527_11110 [Clostridiaceae bacterium]|jgi:tRNA (guanine6-N2)-methyltransferase|nr:hypothetical protein [Clostridiaceae bacterium]